MYGSVRRYERLIFKQVKGQCHRKQFRETFLVPAKSVLCWAPS